MSRLSGKAGDVYIASQEIESCEDVWDEFVDVDVTASADTTDYKVGSASAKFVCAVALINGDIIASEVITSTNLTTYNQVMFWAKSSVAITTAGDLQLLLDEDPLCASPLALDIPVLVANTWKYCKVAATLTDYDATISVGAKLTANDPGAFTLWLDDIRAAKRIAGVRSWTLDQTVEAVESTGFDSSGHRTYTVGTDGWSGTFNGFKDGAPLTIGSIVGLELRESATATQQYRGSVIITDLSVNVTVDGLVEYNYTYQGNDALMIATA